MNLWKYKSAKVFYPAIKWISKHRSYFPKTPFSYSDKWRCTVTNTTACNARCLFCRYSKSNPPSIETMPDLLFKEIVNQLRRSGHKSVRIYPVIGEPLLDLGIFDKIREANKNNLSVDLITNGIMLNNDKIRNNLISSELNSLEISICDLDPTIEANMFGIEQSVAEEKIIGVIKLLASNDKIPVSLSFRCARNPYYICNHPLWKIVEKSGCRFSFMLSFDNRGGKIESNLSSPSNINLPCIGLNVLSVMPSGCVRLCGCKILDEEKDDLYVGNVIGGLEKCATKIPAIKFKFTSSNRPLSCVWCSMYYPEKLEKN